MQAVIFAAGRGTRLKPLTDKLPKPMLSVAGRPILEYVLASLPREVDEALLVIGDMGETIKDYFGTTYRDIKLSYVENVEPRGTSYALAQARPFLKDDFFLLLNGADLYHPEDFGNCLSRHKMPISFVCETDMPHRFGMCHVSEDGFLQDMIEKPKTFPGTIASTGSFLINKNIFDIPVRKHANGEMVLSEQVGSFAKIEKMKVYKVNYWRSIDTHEDLKYAEEEIKDIPYSF